MTQPPPCSALRTPVGTEGDHTGPFRPHAATLEPGGLPHRAFQEHHARL